MCEADIANPDDEPETDPNVPRSGFFTLGVALHELAGGGAEEGEWWYDTFEVVIDPDMPAPSIHKTRTAAELAEAAMAEALKPHNVGRYEVNSVLSTGIYVPMIYDGYPRFLPEVRPRYE